MSKNSMPGVDSETDRAILGRNFRTRREKLGLSQRDVYQLTGIAQSHISEIESGRCNVAVDTMVKLAAITKTDLWKLLKP